MKAIFTSNSFVTFSTHNVASFFPFKTTHPITLVIFDEKSFFAQSGPGSGQQPVHTHSTKVSQTDSRTSFFSFCPRLLRFYTSGNGYFAASLYPLSKNRFRVDKPLTLYNSITLLLTPVVCRSRCKLYRLLYLLYLGLFQFFSENT